MSKIISIAIDGPSGAGKSTISKALAQELQMMYLDTGALFRALAYAALQEDVNPNDITEVTRFLPQVDLQIRFIDQCQRVLINGDDITDFIRTEAVSKAASDISKHPVIRNYILEKERALSRQESFILDGRDIGTVVLPNADVKIFLTASPEIRAERRFLDLREIDAKTEYDQVLKDILARDEQDRSRATAPAVAAEDAIVIDSGNLSLDETIASIKQIILEKISATEV